MLKTIRSDVNFLIPWLKEFQTNKIENMFDRYKDQSLMASRLYYACLISNTPMFDKFPKDSKKGFYFLYDYFLNRKHDGSFHYFDHTDNYVQNNIKIICECSEKESRVHKQFSNIQFNPFVCNYLKPYEKDKFYRSNIIDKFNRNELTVPLGSISKFCNKDFHKSPVIILDEPHSWTMRKISSDRKRQLKPIEGEDQDIYSYFKSLEICAILEKKGFEINTFLSRCENSAQFLFEEKKRPWIPYLEILNLYSRGSLFFSHYQETHGFSVYDNLHMGNAVIIFEENFNSFVINQFQNGVKLSLKMESKLCADIIENYFLNFYNKDIYEQIKDDSFKNFSCETYIERFKKALQSEVT